MVAKQKKVCSRVKEACVFFSHAIHSSHVTFHVVAQHFYGFHPSFSTWSSVKLVFVFGYVFQLRTLPEFRETEFVLFMMLGYLPWFALAESVGKSTSLLMEKAGLITKVKFPVQILHFSGNLKRANRNVLDVPFENNEVLKS